VHPSDQITSAHRGKIAPDEPTTEYGTALINGTLAVYVVFFSILMPPYLYSWCGNAVREGFLHLMLLMPLAVALSWLLTYLASRQCPSVRYSRLASLIATATWLTALTLALAIR